MEGEFGQRAWCESVPLQVQLHSVGMQGESARKNGGGISGKGNAAIGV